jgi:hypothetical protein
VSASAAAPSERYRSIVRILYALVCEDATSRQDGRLDAEGVFHQLYAPGFPAQQDRMVLAVALEWDAGESGRHEFRIDLTDPSRSPCLTVSGHTDVTPTAPGEAPAQTRLVLPLEGVVFPAAGSYLFELEVAGTKTPLTPLHLVENG